MRKLFMVLAAVSLMVGVCAQSPQKMSYQAVIRNAVNALVTNQSIGLQVTILQGSVSGTEVFKEKYEPNPQTNANGLVTIEIGTGIPFLGAFSSINWSNGPYFIKTETDPTGGTIYTITGTSELLSVPYALHSKTAETLSGGITEIDPVFGSSPAKGISSTNVTNWNTAYGWGNHAIAGYLKSYTETDPIWTSASANYYTKTNMQTSGASQLHFNNLTNKPTILAGYGITDAGDNWGTQSVVTDATLTGNGIAATPLKIAQQSATIGQVLKWTGIAWTPGNDFNAIPGGVSGNVQFNNSGLLGGDANFQWDNTYKRLGIGSASPDAMLQVNDRNNTRQIAASDWADMSSGIGGYGLFASNAYLNNSLNTLHFSNTHASLGASGIIFNYPYWQTASIFVNEPAGGSVKDQAFTPNVIASFKPGEVNVNNNKITNVADPVNARDAATKEYVDVLINQLYAQGVLKVKDMDENLYNVVKIGMQIWMAENLKTTKYNDGTAIPLVTDNSAWGSLTTPGYCWYNNDKLTYGNTYGALYNWYSVNTGKLCPAGWHVPSDAEWTTLTTFLGGEDVAGGKMKEAGVTHWAGPNTGATNETGFTALPTGIRNYNGPFNYIGYYSGLWSSTESSSYHAWYRYVHNGASFVGRNYDAKPSGFSVRCLRD